MASGYNVRVGDTDREAVAAQLREHYADGRLTLEELNERLDEAFAAKTKADLNTVMRDLPQAARPFGGTGSGARPGPAWPPPGYGSGNWGGPGPGAQGPRPGFGVFAPIMGLVWLFVILGAFMLFGGVGGGGRPLAVVLILAALALVRRLFGFGRRRGCGGPRGPRGRRRW